MSIWLKIVVVLFALGTVLSILYRLDAEFLALGTGLSIFYGLYAVKIFVPEDNEFVRTRVKYKSWWVHQFWLNFMCSEAGWVAAFYFTFYRVFPYSAYTPKASDVWIVLFALLGMGGFLPLTLSLVPTALGSLVSLAKKAE